MLGLDRLELDGDFLARDDVDTKVDVTCSSVQLLLKMAVSDPTPIYSV